MRTSLFLLLMLSSSLAWAQEERSDVFDRIYVIQKMETVVRGRIEVAPMAGYIANDPYFHQLAVGGNLGFHITEEWGLGGTFVQYFAMRSSFFGQAQRDYAIFPADVHNEWGAGGWLTWAPIRGKVALYPLAIMHTRFYVKTGAGVLRTSTGLHPDGELGLGLQLLAMSFWSVVVELTDQMYIEKYNARDEFKNQFLVRAGFSFLIPVL
jgi:outer membrane beta-barrel protein